MKKSVLFCLLIVLIFAGSAQARLKVDFHFTDLDGQSYSPESLKGKPVVIYVGSTL